MRGLKESIASIVAVALLILIFMILGKIVVTFIPSTWTLGNMGVWASALLGILILLANVGE